MLLKAFRRLTKGASVISEEAIASSTPPSRGERVFEAKRKSPKERLQPYREMMAEDRIANCCPLTIATLL